MIRTFKIELNAANPNVPLAAFRLFKDSAMRLAVLNVPRCCASVKAKVTKISDSTSTEYAATRDGSAWIITVPAGMFGTVGTAIRGIHIFGTDAATTPNTYDLGGGDLVVLDANGTITPSPTPAGGGDMKYSDFNELDEEESSLRDVIRKLKHLPITALFALALLPAFADLEIHTAKLGTLPAKAYVVTNITGTAGVDQEAVKAIVDTEVGGTNLVKTASAAFAANTNIIFSVQGGTLSIADHGTNLWSSAAAPAPSAIVTANSLCWRTDGATIRVNEPTALTVTADGWVDGQAQLALITLATGATIAPSISYVGYAELQRDQECLCAVVRVGSRYYLTVNCVITND